METVELAKFSAGDNLKKLVGTGKSGDFVLANQKLASDHGFGKVATAWYDKTLSYEQGMEELAKGRAETHDILASLSEMSPAMLDGKFVMRYKSGQQFTPTPHAVAQMGGWAGCGSWFVNNLLESPTDRKGEPMYARDKLDAETLAHVLRNGFRRIDPDKKFLWRTRQDGTLRAMLSDSYGVVNNQWFLESFQKLVPGGRLSHWIGDSDTVWGNILIPDTIREEKDSDYGGMLSVGNSEIGERNIQSWPSAFRAICMNGCIWDRTEGVGIKKPHRGKIDLDQLFVALKLNLELQIPLLPQGIHKLLGTRALGWDGQSILPLFAQVSLDARLSRKQASGLLHAYNAERATTPDYARSLFGVVNAITRAGQTQTNVDWVRFDELGGRLASLDKEDWERLKGRAKSLTSAEVEDAFATS